MQYIEIGQDIVDAIKGGATGTGASETEEIVKNIQGFGAICAEIAKSFWEIFNAIKTWMGK